VRFRNIEIMENLPTPGSRPPRAQFPSNNMASFCPQYGHWPENVGGGARPAISTGGG
jgi:hypothetical protein